MVEPALIPDLVIALSAALGLLIVRAQILANGIGLSWRFRTLLAVTAAFYVFRSLDWVTDSGWARVLAVAGAASIPFTGLLLVEGMVRRHAPKVLKVFAGAGLVTLVVLSMLPWLNNSFGFLLALLIYQFALLFSGLVILNARTRSDYFPPENAMFDRISIAVPVILILMLTDYELIPIEGLPRMSGVAALGVAWLAATFEARAASGRFVFAALLTIAGMSAVAALAIQWQFDLGGVDALSVAVMLAALSMLLVIWLSSNVLARARQQTTLDRALTQTQDLDTYLCHVAGLGLSDGYAILHGRDLAQFDDQALIEAFGPSGVLTTADLPKSDAKDTLGQSQARALMERYGAQEVILVAPSPLHLAVGTPSGLSGGSEATFRAVFAVARLIAARDAERGTT